MRAFLLAACLAPSALAGQTALGHRSVTLGRPLASAAPIPAAEYRSWTRAQLEAVAGKLLAYQSPGHAPVAQQFVPAAAFSRDEARLIGRLKALSAGGKFERRDSAERYAVALERTRRLNGKQADPALRLSDDEVFEYASAMARPRGAEVGAWRLPLRSGRASAAIHSSSRRTLIREEHFLPALNALLLAAHTTWNDVEAVQYFHTHPTPDFLSPGDEKTALSVAAQVPVPVHMYAIPAGLDGLFHIGAPPGKR